MPFVHDVPKSTETQLEQGRSVCENHQELETTTAILEAASPRRTNESTGQVPVNQSSDAGADLEGSNRSNRMITTAGDASNDGRIESEQTGGIQMATSMNRRSTSDERSFSFIGGLDERPKSRKKDSIQHEDENKLVNISQEHVEPSSPSAPGDNVRKTSDESSTSKDDGQIRLQRFGGKFAGEVTSEDSLDTKDPETSRM
ncbi:unnamed protein product [Anisakis simplex]|uniref:Uncharacterized protein n=1 Tax=Anisakis simplex TaxID=6269 RepID=A0A0M3JCI0_ANISI|nr:unnamed protein product [Anisakis simplex]